LLRNEKLISELLSSEQIEAGRAAGWSAHPIANGLGRVVEAGRRERSGKSVCRFIEDQACTAIPADGERTDDQRIRQSRALWRAQRVSRSEFIGLA
jgi:hypothetical protein